LHTIKNESYSAVFFSLLVDLRSVSI